jgi:hypothetical protein
MSTIVNRNDVPSHLFSIPELDLSEDLFAERLNSPWFRLGAWTIEPKRDERGLENVVLRKSFLLPSEGFADMFDNLGFVGNLIADLGEPRGSLINESGHAAYRYGPFHEFKFALSSVIAEPLVFLRFTTSGAKLVVNPDLWFFFKLEETTPNSGIWWDPPKGIEAMRQRVIEQGNLEIVEIRVDYLCKYLQARQLALVVGHYCRRSRLCSSANKHRTGPLSTRRPESGV